MVIKNNLMLLLLSSLVLSACAQLPASSCQLPLPPTDVMKPPSQTSLLVKMESLLMPSTTLQAKPKDTGSN